MNAESNANAPECAKQGSSLTTAKAHSAQATDLVEECADDLSVVSSVLMEEFADRKPLPKVENAIDTAEAAKDKAQTAFEKLSIVNQALEDESQEKQLLEQQLESAMEHEAAALHAALHDPLTGLPNRALFNDRLEHGLAQARRHQWALAVMFVDLDDFKAINDAYGHTVGDAVLQTIAMRLKENTRGDDTVCRHGGDEFLYLLVEIRDKQDAILVAQKIIDAIGLPAEVRAGDACISLQVACSIGIALFPSDGADATTLTNSADQAMYRAKRDRLGYTFAL
jgi:diguanylate cyclase